MTTVHWHTLTASTLFGVTIVAALSLMGLRVTAQNPELQQRLGELKAVSAQNKQALATYSWQEQDTISLKGEVKKQDSYKVRIGADGKPMKTPLNPTQASAQPPASAGGHRGGRLKEKVVENKKQEYKEYGQEIAALAHSYAPPDPAKLQQAVQKGNVKLTPGRTSGEIQLLISNYLKPNDSMTITFNKAEKAIQNVQIASYLDSPSDAANIAVQFSKLADGTNHIATMTIEGVSKQLKVAIANSNYQKL